MTVGHEQEETAELCTTLSNSSCQQQQHYTILDARSAVQAGLATASRIAHGITRWVVRARGRTWCRRFEMSTDAWDGWSEFHVNTSVAIAYFWVFEAGQLPVSIYIATALRIDRSLYCYLVTVPWMVNIAY